MTTGTKRLDRFRFAIMRGSPRARIAAAASPYGPIKSWMRNDRVMVWQRSAATIRAWMSKVPSNVVSGTLATGAVALEAILLEPVIAPIFTGCDAAAVEAGEFALQLAKQLQVRP